LDVGSTPDKHELIRRLIESNVILDSVHLCLTNASAGLARLSLLADGFAFQSVSAAEGVQLFEKEAFLSLAIRGAVGVRLDPKGISPSGFERANPNFDEIGMVFQLTDPRRHISAEPIAPTTLHRLTRFQGSACPEE
jgi:hypothetical protein